MFNVLDMMFRVPIGVSIFHYDGFMFTLSEDGLFHRYPCPLSLPFSQVAIHVSPDTPQLFKVLSSGAGTGNYPIVKYIQALQDHRSKHLSNQYSAESQVRGSRISDHACLQ